MWYNNISRKEQEREKKYEIWIKKVNEKICDSYLTHPPILVLNDDLFKWRKKMHPANSSFLTPHLSLNQLSRAAFTLAEVLITLVVLGIIAAITVPTLRNSLDDKKYRVPLKKTYAVLSEAFDLTFNFSDLAINDSNSMYKNFRALADKLGIAKVCCSVGKTPDQDECYFGTEVELDDCFTQPSQLDGTTDTVIQSVITSKKNNKSSFLLKDGTSVLIFAADSRKMDLAGIFGFDTSFRDSVAVISNYVYYFVLIDVNGKKSPNIYGKDVHIFVYTKKHGLLPAGVDSHTGTIPAGMCSGSDKLSCTFDYLNSEE